MKTLIIFMAFLLGVVFITPVLAQEKPLAKLNADQVIRAAEFVKRYQALANNPEAMKALMRIAESMKNKQTNK